MALIELVLMLGACAVEPEPVYWDDVPGATLTPVGDDAWNATVRDAVDAWSAALAPRGCPPPFVVGDDGVHPVVLVDELPDGVAGVEHSVEGSIEVLDRSHRDLFLLHELGHAIGLGHATTSPSIMRSPISVLDLDNPIAPVDVDAAAIALGCP